MRQLDQVWVCHVPGCGRIWITAYLASWHEAKMHDGAQTCWLTTLDPTVGAHRFLAATSATRAATPAPAGPARTA